MTELTKAAHKPPREEGDLPLAVYIAGWLAVAWAVVALLIDINADKIWGR